MLSQEIINHFREEKQRHINELNAINDRVKSTLSQYQRAVDEEILAIESIDNMFIENGVSIEEELITPENNEVVIKSTY